MKKIRAHEAPAQDLAALVGEFLFGERFYAMDRGGVRFYAVGRGGPRWAAVSRGGPRWAAVGRGGPRWATVGRGGSVQSMKKVEPHWGVNMKQNAARAWAIAFCAFFLSQLLARVEPPWK